MSDNFDPIPLKVEVTRSALGRLMGRYESDIRPHTTQERLGVIRLLQRLLTKDVTYEQIVTAIDNYKAHCDKDEVDMRFRKSMRSFFTKQNIDWWQTPLPSRKFRETAKNANETLVRLAKDASKRREVTQVPLEIAKETEPEW